MLSVDFANATDADYHKIEELVSKLNASVLVNNVGISNTALSPFADESFELIEPIIDVNIKATLRMTQICLKQMVLKKNGLILNIGSFTGTVPACPMLSVYGGSKAFINSWSQAISYELEQSGIHVEAISPMYVVSNMSKIKRASLTVPSEATFAKWFMRNVGKLRLSSPYPVHALVTKLFLLLPTSIGSRLIMSNTRAARARMERNANKRNS